MANREITNFFRASKKSSAISPSIETKTATDQFYSLCLREKIEKCNNLECCTEKNELKARCIEQEEKLREINQAIEICSGFSRRKEKKIDKLQKEMEVAEKIIEPVACINKSNDANKFFSTFENVLTHDELARLRSILPNQKFDSSFVLNSIRFLYKNNNQQISSLSLTGRSRGSEAKQRICPEKYETVKNLFLERLTSLKLNSNEFTNRLKQLNQLMKNAFINTKRHGKPTDDEEMIRKINENKDAN